MQDSFDKIQELAGHITEYVDNRIHAVKLETAEKISGIVSKTIAFIIALFIAAVFVLFLSVALAEWLAKLTGEYYWGFLIVGGVYFLIALITWSSREKIFRIPLMNAMLRQFFEQEENNDETN